MYPAYTTSAKLRTEATNPEASGQGLDELTTLTREQMKSTISVNIIMT